MNTASIEKPRTELSLPERAVLALGDAANVVKLRELVQASASIVTVTNPDGREQAHRAGMTLMKMRTTITSTGKAAREDATAFSKAVIAEERKLIAIIEPEEERVFGLRDAYDTQEKAKKDAAIAAERARVDAIKTHIAAIRNLPLSVVGKSATEISAVISSLAGSPIDESYEELQAEAAQARHDALDQLAKAETAQRAVEIEAESKRQAETRAAAERAEEAARLKAEREELDRQRAEQDARNKAAENALEEARAAQAAELQAQRAEAEQRAAERAEAARKAQADFDAQRAELARQQAEMAAAQRMQREAAESIERARVDRIQASVQALRDFPNFASGKSSADLTVLLDSFHATPIHDSFAEFKADAEAAKQETVKRLEEMLAGAIEHEQAAEAACIDQERRDAERAAQMAAERAEREAEETAAIVDMKVRNAAHALLEAAQNTLEFLQGRHIENAGAVLDGLRAAIALATE